MAILMGVLLLVGWIVLMVGGIMLIVAAFRHSVVWGLCVLFLGPAGLIFLIMHWEEAKPAFRIQMLGLLIFIGCVGLLALQGPTMMQPLLQKLAETGLSEKHTAAFQKLALETMGEEMGGEMDGEWGEDVPPEPAQPVQVDGKDPKSLEGATLAEVREKLGRPKGEMKSGRELCLLYDKLTVFSADGETVSHVEVEGAAPRGKKPAHTALAGQVGAAGDNVPSVQMISNGGQRVNMKSITVPGKVTLVDFYADWCGPCKIMGPKLEQIARTDPDVKLCKIDVVNWDTPVVAQYKIRSIPHVQVYDRNGTPVGSGAARLDEIKQNISRAK
ncbi:MAG: thioredoxin family protein [Lentisphaerae bacterium]|nr:thioredoxin family protein [Lentisphaerota bacterium]